MTAQAPDKLINKHWRVPTRRWFKSLGLFGVLKVPVYCQHGIPYEFAQKPDIVNRRKVFSNNLYRGYIATFCLQGDGQLVLQGYSYPISAYPIEYDYQSVNEILRGDFWIVLQRHFHDNWCRLIPFQDGHVITDRKQWRENTWDLSCMTPEQISAEIKHAFDAAYEEHPHLPHKSAK